MGINEDAQLTKGKNIKGAQQRDPYIEPAVGTAIAEQLMSKLQGNKNFGELGVIANNMDMEAVSAAVIRKLESRMTTMSDQDMSAFMKIGMQIADQIAGKKPSVNKIVKDIFEASKLLKIDLTSTLEEIMSGIKAEEPEPGSMLGLMQGYMARSREIKEIDLSIKTQFFGFINHTVNESHRLYRRQFN